MNVGTIARHVGYAHLAVCLVMVVPGGYALAGQHNAWIGYALGMLSAGLISALCFAVGVGERDQAVARNGLRELMISLLLFWVATPIAAAIPFTLEGYSFDEAWFEAVSALTTTGAWLSEPIARSTEHDMLYRSGLQWIGGLASLATAAAIFVRPEFIGVNPTTPPFARGESGSYIRAFDQAVRAFFPVYALLTSISFAAFVSVGVPGPEAATMAFSLIGSGGFVPHQFGMDAYSVGAGLVAGITMVLSAVNFTVIASMFLARSRLGRGHKDSETLAFLIMVPCIAFILWISLGAGDLDRLGSQIFNAISLLSTNGVLVGDASPSLVPVLVTAIIGGAAVSTAGGIKLLRWLVTFRRAREEVWKLIHPGAVVRSGGAANEFGVWIHTLAFAVITAALVLTTAFFGFSLETSATAAVAIISNTGPMIELAPDMTADYRVFDPALRWIFGFGMIAGRLELVLLLVVLNRTFWEG